MAASWWWFHRAVRFANCGDAAMKVRANTRSVKLFASSSVTASFKRRTTSVFAVLGAFCAAAGYVAYQAVCREKKHLAFSKNQDQQSRYVQKSPVTLYQDQQSRYVQKLPVTLYQYQNCPFCGKVRAFLDYYGFDYNIVEVNPLWKSEVKFSQQYRKVPIVIVGEKQINDSSVIISALRSYMTGTDPLELIVTYYPEMKFKNSEGKEVVEYVNRYYVMTGQAVDKKLQKQLQEEREWREWVDSTFVHTLSPNIYRTAAEAMQAFEYFSQLANVGVVERYATRYGGSIAMYFIGKHIKNKYKLKDDVRQSLYEEADKWVKAVGMHRFMGGSTPNLADLAVYGVLSGIEGLDAFNDLMTHTAIKPWYNLVKDAVRTHAGAETG